MGMELLVRGVIPADDDYAKKRAAYRACEAAGIEPPKELRRFFNDMPPDDKGIVVSTFDRTEIGQQLRLAIEPLQNQWGYDVDLSALPKEIKMLRFTAG